jgi:hypothetical protein
VAPAIRRSKDGPTRRTAGQIRSGTARKPATEDYTGRPGAKFNADYGGRTL